MQSQTAGSPDEAQAGPYGISPTNSMSHAAGPGANKPYGTPYSSVHMPHTMDALDLSMSPPYMQRMSAMNAHGLVESPKPFQQPQSLDGKRRRTSATTTANMSPMLGTPMHGPPSGEHDMGQMGQSVRDAGSHQYMHPYPIGLGVHNTPPNPGFCFPPGMSSMPVPDTPTSVASAPGGLLNQQNSQSPLAHRGTFHSVQGELPMMPTMMVHQQQKLGHGMPPLQPSMPPLQPSMHPAQPAFYDSPTARRVGSHGAVPPWPTPDSDCFFNVSPAGPSGGAMLPPGQQPSAMRPVPLQRQYSAPQPRMTRERTERKASTDVWPDDVEVAFWEALRLIPKLGRRKVLVHGKPCGRNELIADYIERKTNKTRSRKQVSSHIQVLKNVKRNDPEFQQLIAEPAAEEDYYTPAGGMMYAQPLADYSSGLLGVSLLTAPNDPSLIVSPSPLSSATLSPNPNLMSPLPSGLSPRGSPATGAIASALDNLHFTASPKPMSQGALSPQLATETTLLADVDPAPMVLPSSFSMWTYASTTEDKHVYAKLDSAALSRVLQNATPLPVVPLSAPNLSSFRFPKLDEMYKQLDCPCFHVHVPLSLPRLSPTSPPFDRFGVALSLASTKNTPLLSILSIYSHSKCVLSMVERLEAPRPLAMRRADSLNARSPQPAAEALGPDAGGAGEAHAASPADGSKSPAMGAQDKYRWSYQAPFASEFWADFLSRNHPVHMYGSGGLDVAPSFCKEPSERAALGLAVSGVTFVQEFVLPNDADTPVHTVQNPPELSGSDISPGSKLGEVVCVVAWEYECVEMPNKQSGVPVVSLIKNTGHASTAQPPSEPNTPQKSAATMVPSTPTPRPKTMLGLELQPANAALADPEYLGAQPSTPPRVERDRTGGEASERSAEGAASSLEVPHAGAAAGGMRPPLPRLTTTEPSPQAPAALKRDPSPGQAPSSAHALADVAARERGAAAKNAAKRPAAGLQPGAHSPFLLQNNLTNEQPNYSAFLNDTGHASTLLPSMKFESLHTSVGLPPSSSSDSFPAVSAPMRSNSMSVLDEHESALPTGTTAGLSATVNSLTDPLAFDSSGDASVRLGISAGQMPWSLQQDFMDAFLNNPTSDTVLVGPGSPPSVSPTTLSFSTAQDTSARTQPLDVSLMSTL